MKRVVANRRSAEWAERKVEMSDQYNGPEMAKKILRLEAALSGRTVSCSNCNQMAASRDRLKRVLENISVTVNGQEMEGKWVRTKCEEALRAEP